MTSSPPAPQTSSFDLPPSGIPLAGRHAISRPHASGWWDAVTIETCGLLRIDGWQSAEERELEPPQAIVNGEEVPLTHAYKTHRPDIAEARGGSAFCGRAFEYLFPRPLDVARSVVVRHEGVPIFVQTGEAKLHPPAYDFLFDCDRVLHREQIYCTGDPAPEANPTFVALIENLPEPMLDFGCGSGAMVRELRSRGKEAYGIELDCDRIRKFLKPDVEPYVTLYGGEFPLPFEGGAFASTYCTEVLEHLPDCEGSLAQIARVTRDRAVFTVPDIHAIPLCFQHFVVPWHLLESTHLHFFNQSSLGKILRKFFSRVEFARTHPVSINGTVFYTSLAALCQK